MMQYMEGQDYDPQCEMVGPENDAKRLYTLAPGTSLQLCEECAGREGLEEITPQLAAALSPRSFASC